MYLPDQTREDHTWSHHVVLLAFDRSCESKPNCWAKKKYENEKKKKLITWSKVEMAGERPPCTQNTRSTITHIERFHQKIKNHYLLPVQIMIDNQRSRCNIACNFTTVINDWCRCFSTSEKNVPNIDRAVFAQTFFIKAVYYICIMLSIKSYLIFFQHTEKKKKNSNFVL